MIIKAELMRKKQSIFEMDYPFGRTINKEDENDPSFLFWPEYLIKRSSKITANNHVLIDSAIEIQWCVKEEDTNQGKYQVEIFEKEKKLTKTPSIYKEIMNISNQIYTVYSHLIFTTVFDGSISQLLNQDEIWEKWQEIESGELSSYFEGEQNTIIKNQMDQEFQNPIPYLNQNWLYYFFFLRPQKQQIHQRQITSELLQGEKINLSIQISPINSNTDDIQEWEIHGKLQSSNASARESYKNQYELLCGEAYFHEYHLHAHYTLQKSSLLSCEVQLKESANDNLYSETTISIQKLKS